MYRQLTLVIFLVMSQMPLYGIVSSDVRLYPAATGYKLIVRHRHPIHSTGYE